MPLTGKFDFRRSFGGKLVLRLEEERSSWWPQARRRWRDARNIDLASPELKALLDLRCNPLVCRSGWVTLSHIAVATAPLAQPGQKEGLLPA